MFYSESLLSKTGPLARVWLASNLDRKLTKQNVLASKLEDNVKDIIGGGQAPMALRLSSQLLLGVCKIYNRKATYLMDDCSEALVKIKMAFRPGNVDLPSNQSHKANPNALLLPDTITELDLFAPLPDPEDFLSGADYTLRAPGQDPTLLDFGMSQLLDSQAPISQRQEKRLLQLDDDDLGLEIGLDEDYNNTRLSDGPSIEIGRRAQSVRPDQPSLLLDEDDLGLDLGMDDDDGDDTLRPLADKHNPSGLLAMPDEDVAMTGIEDHEPLPFDDDTNIAAANAAALARADAALRRQRDSDSPLSSARSSLERELENTFNPPPTSPTTPHAARQHAQKRRKITPLLPIDSETELPHETLKSQQEDRSAILCPPSFLPRDPLLLQLMELQRRGGLGSVLLGDGYLQGWAPELRGIMSLEVVRAAGRKRGVGAEAEGAAKRKRDSGVGDLTDEEDDLPQMEIPNDDTAMDFDQGAPTPAPFNFDNDDDLNANDEVQALEDSYAGMGISNNTFDVTEAPLLHPSQSGPVALGTKKMVHLLREHFGPSTSTSTTDSEVPSPSRRTKTSVLFTELCPESFPTAASKKAAPPASGVTRDQATKMFFELLVLGTKDAIKVEQEVKDGLGGKMRIRGKRGLWGDWAEMTGATQADGLGTQAEGAAAVEVAA